MIHILLINSNPVVSRLLALCTREDTVVLEEAQTLSSLQRKHYDIVFIDEASYKDEVLELHSHVTTRQKILFSHENNPMPSFDSVIQKPFLPFQIIDIIDNTPIVEHVEMEEEIPPNTSIIDELAEDTPQTQVLDEVEIQKIKDLLEMEAEDVIFSTETLSETEIEERKREIIKEQLVSDGLEIVEEQEMIESFDSPQIYIDLEKDSKPSRQKTNMKKTKMKKTKKQKNTLKNYSKKERKLLKAALRLAIQGVSKKKIKKLLQGQKVKLTLQIEAP